jgi:hypothetical protein
MWSLEAEAGEKDGAFVSSVCHRMLEMMTFAFAQLIPYALDSLKLPMFFTHKLSQDSLEADFGRLRHLQGGDRNAHLDRVLQSVGRLSELKRQRDEPIRGSNVAGGSEWSGGSGGAASKRHSLAHMDPLPKRLRKEPPALPPTFRPSVYPVKLGDTLECLEELPSAALVERFHSLAAANDFSTARAKAIGEFRHSVKEELCLSKLVLKDNRYEDFWNFQHGSFAKALEVPGRPEFRVLHFKGGMGQVYFFTRFLYPSSAAAFVRTVQTFFSA